MQVVGIDPALKNTAIAFITRDDEGKLNVSTMHLTDLLAGDYTKALKEISDNKTPDIYCGFVEDFSKVGGGKTNKDSIKAVSHSGGMAEEAIVAAGIPLMPIEVGKWRKVLFGKAPKSLNKSGKYHCYWTKGGPSPVRVPNNLAAPLLRLLNDIRGGKIHENAKYHKLPDTNLVNFDDFEHVLDWLNHHYVTSKRIQIVFGVSMDELEAFGIAMAGLKLLEEGKIEGM